MQYIQEYGTKRFAKNNHKEGCFHTICGLDAMAMAPTIVSPKATQTAAHSTEALDFSTVPAFYSGNLPHAECWRITIGGVFEQILKTFPNVYNKKVI
jgi:phage/plasmid primase-like uncharacterized protein